jgi:hypothetical protein
MVVEMSLELRGLRRGVEIVSRRRESLGRVAHDFRRIAQDAAIVGAKDGRRETRRSRVGMSELAVMHAIDR